MPTSRLTPVAAAILMLLSVAGCGGSDNYRIEVYDPGAAASHKLAQAEADCKTRKARYDDQDRHNDQRKIGSILLAYRVGKSGPEDAHVLCSYPNSDCVGDALDWVRRMAPHNLPVGTEMRADYQYDAGRDEQPTCKTRNVDIIQ